MTDYNICSKHIADNYIKRYIRKYSTRGICSYCERKKNIISVKSLANYIEEAIRSEYDDPYSQGAIYHKEAVYYEDRFPGVTVNYTEDLLQDLFEVDDFAIFQDISSHFGNNYWSEIDGIWGPTRDQYLKGGWDYFKEIIKHQVRFMFFDENLRDKYDDEYGEKLNPFYILKEVEKGIKSLNLLKKYPTGKLETYRGRQHNKGKKYNTARELGSPPPSLAKANRMSPAGISMYYGAFDRLTCEMEVVDKSKTHTSFTTGKFINLKELTLIDFTKLKLIPSIFDKKKRAKRPIASFILSFIRDLSVPVRPDDSVHIDYLPTQIVTEYIRLIFGKKTKVDGIIYNSVKNKEGKCIVLFVQNNEIINKMTVSDESDVERMTIIEEMFGKSETKEYLDNKILLLDNTTLDTKRVN